MALTEKQMANVTLAEFEEMARRFSGALAVLREAQSLLGASVVTPVTQPMPTQSPAPPTPMQAQVVTRAQAEASDAWRQGLDDEQQQYLEQMRASGERAKLLSQIRGEDS